MKTYLIREVAAKLGVHKVKIQAYINKGLISAPPLKPMKGDPRFPKHLHWGVFREWTDSEIEDTRRQLEAVRFREKQTALYSTKRVAEMLGIPRSSLLNAIHSGKIKGPSVTVKNASLPGSPKTYSSIQLWNDDDIARLEWRPREYRQTTLEERKQRERKHYHHVYYVGHKPEHRVASVKHADKKRGRPGNRSEAMKARWAKANRKTPGPKPLAAQDTRVFRTGELVEKAIPRFQQICSDMKALPPRERRNLGRARMLLKQQGKTYSETEIEAARHSPTNATTAARWYVAIDTMRDYGAIAKSHQLYRKMAFKYEGIN